jgi:hypothetical protein
VELALASYPGFTLTAPPGEGAPFGVFRAEHVPAESVDHTAVLPDGARVAVAPPTPTGTRIDPAGPAEPSHPTVAGPTQRIPLWAALRPRRKIAGSTVVPLGRVIGARSGDKAGDANLGVWARSDDAYAWLRGFLTVDDLRRLLPEAAELRIDRHELPNLRALNFVIHGLLGEGVAASTRFDPQAKALGEWLRARLVDIPDEVVRPTLTKGR